MKMGSGSAIIPVWQRSFYIGMGRVLGLACSLFFQKVKEVLRENFVITPVQLINLPIGITPVKVVVISLLFRTQKVIQKGNFAGIYVPQINISIGMALASANAISRFLLQDGKTIEIFVIILVWEINICSGMDLV